MSARRKARELTLKALYAQDMGQDSPPDIFESLANGSKLDEATLQFAHDLFDAVVSDCADLDQEISRLASNWSLDRLAPIDKNILRLSITELSHFSDIPKRVSINEAIELARRFGSAESPAFVNGILDAFARDIN